MARTRPSIQIRVARAWALVAAWVLVVLWLGGADFGAVQTSGMLGHLIRFFDPDMPWEEFQQLHHTLRKAAHVVEYAVLALLAFRAMWLTFHTLLGRIAGLALLLVLVVATADETRQALLGGRTGSAGDVLLDATGALAALGIVLLYMRRRRTPAAAGEEASGP
jgi:VanZ family protein